LCSCANTGISCLMNHSRRSWRICIKSKREDGLQWPRRCSRLSLILEAYTGVSDDEVIEATMMDRRWQLVLDCIDTEEAPISLGTLVASRRRLIEGQMDRRRISRPIEIAAQSQAFGSRPLRAALDSSPLWGAGRVEDTYNLIGHALKKVIRVVADRASERTDGGGERGWGRGGLWNELESSARSW
jgi:hypothetical protein